MALYAKDFAKVFSDILEKSGVTCYQISKYADIDQAYLSRLKTGQKGNPSPETVVRICLALARSSDKPGLYDFEKLFKAIGRSLFLNQKSSPYD